MKSYLKCSENRVIARVCGGGTLAKMPRLRGALPKAKGKGGGVQGAYSKVNSGMGKVAMVLLAAIFLLQMGCSNTTTHQEFYSSGELWKERTYYSRDTSTYLEKTFFRNGQLMSVGNYLNSKRDGIWQGWFFDGYQHWEAVYIEGTPKSIPDDPVIQLISPDDSDWYVQVPKFFRLYVEGSTPYNVHVVCYCDFILPDTIDHNFSIGVIPKKPGAMMLHVMYLENGEYFSIGKDTIYVHPNPNDITTTVINDEIEQTLLKPRNF